MYGALDISTSGMVAQRTRLEAIAANLAGKDATYDAAGRVSAYKRRQVHIAAGDPLSHTSEGRQLGVHVAEIQINEAAVRLKYDPKNPDAYQDGPNAGYIAVPDIDLVTEQINGMEAMRAYEANVVAAEATKSMMAQALRLIA